VSFTVADVLLGARDRHPALAPQLTPDVVGRRWVSEAQRRLMSRAIEQDPHYAALTMSADLSTEALVLAALTIGIVLPANFRVLGATVRYTDPIDDEPVTLTSWANRLNRHAVRSAYVLSGTLYLIGDQLEWAGMTQLLITYSPLPVDLTQGGDVLVLTDVAREAITAGLAAYWAARLTPEVMPAPALKELKDAAAMAEAQFLTTIRQPGSARVLMIRGMD
jgi:hypothetical protein